jgi:hypothetical protein
MSQQTRNRTSPGTRSQKISDYLAGAAIALSLLGLAIVVGNVAAGVPPQPDENLWAHLFQFTMAAQVPLILTFAATANWTRTLRTTALLAAQLCAVAAAFGALWWSGY